MRHIIPISGKDSLATAIVQTRLHPEFQYEYIYNDTEMELPETYEWISKVEKKLNIKINRIGKSLEEIIKHKKILPSAKVRYCTLESKIKPMNEWTGGDESTLYIGIRFDEDRIGAIPKKNQKVNYPLIENHVDLRAVYDICESVELMPPNFFWGKMFQVVCKTVGCSGEAIRRELPRYVFDRAFAWRSRPNCFMCFYQRRYEWVGLLEFHPELFDKAEKMENDQIKILTELHEPFYWIQDLPLSEIRKNEDHYFKKRVQELSKMISKNSRCNYFQNHC